MPSRDRVCLECGHAYLWHVRERAEGKLGADPGAERACYRQIAGGPCPCPSFVQSDERVVPIPPLFGNVGRSALLTLLLVVMGLALLYAYRSQTPAIITVPITQAAQDVQAGRVKVVTITGTRATLELTSGTKEQTNLPEGPNNQLVDAVTAYNNANPTRMVVLKYETADSGFSVIGSVLLSLLPVLLIGGFFYYMMNNMRSRRDD